MSVVLLAGYDASRPLTAAPLALDRPDTIDIISARGYGDVDETGDILLVVRYHVDYDSLPSVPASDTVLAWYVDGSSAVRSAAPYVSVRSGYGQGAIGIYFDASDASSFGITHGDADSARVSGNPSAFSSTWSHTESITWRAQGSQDALEEDIENIALALETRSEWSGVNLIAIDSGSNILQAAGEDYFENSIPRMRRIASNLFAATLETPVFVEGDFSQSYESTLEAAWNNSRLSGSFTSLASWLDMPEIAVKTGMTLLAVMAGVGVLAAFVTGQGVPREVSGGLGVMVAAALLAVAALQGMFSLTLLAVLGFFGLLLIATVLFLIRAA